MKKNTKKTVKNKAVKKTAIIGQDRQLCIAVRKGNIVEVRKLIKTGVDLNKFSDPDSGRTPLTNACKYGHLAIVKALITAGAKINRKDRQKKTPLLNACDSYNEKAIANMAAILLNQGAKPDLFTKGENGPLHYAAMYGRVKTVKLLIKQGANVNAHGSYGRTALMYAAADARSPEIVKMLLKAGANLKKIHDGGGDVLYEIITRDDPSPDIAEILIDAGADIRKKHKNYGTALHWAASCGRKDIILLLLRKGAKINAKDSNGETPIVKAMHSSNSEIVNILLDHGADPDSTGQFGNSLLEYAAELEDHELAIKILEKSKKNSTNGGALVQAARTGNLDMVRLLIDAGIDPDNREGWGSETPLLKAAYYGKIEVMKYLIEKGADIKARDSRGNTAFLHAAWSGHTDAVKLLLKHGAELNEKNNLNWNALMQACVEGHYSTVKYLLDKGSPTDEIDKEKGATALSLAKYARSEKLIKLLNEHGARERKIRMRKKGEPYFPITDCDICYYLPHKKDLGRTESPEKIEGLEIIHTEHSSPDRYSDTVDMIKRCTICGTYYHHDHSYDSEDACISGPHIDQNLQRYNLMRLKEVLHKIGKDSELRELEDGYAALMNEFQNQITNHRDDIRVNILPFIIESLTDFFIFTDNWDSMEKLFLRNEKPGIVLTAAQAIIMVYGVTARRGTYPSSSYYRDFTGETQRLLKPMVNKHTRDLKQCITLHKNSSDEEINRKYREIMSSVNYYKVF